MEYLLENQNGVYNYALLAALAVTLVWELVSPNRIPVKAILRRRWRVNLVIPFINFLAAYVIFPTTAVATALAAADAGWGLFNQISVYPVVAFAISVLVLDLANYAQHYLLHRVPLLWRIHRAHHTDPEMDVTTSLRFHPFEFIVGFTVELTIIVLTGAPVLAVVIYRLGRIVLSTLVHGNVRLPKAIDDTLRYVIVTPDIHRVHHSIIYQEHNSNYSGGLIWWDLLFGTYTAQPAAGHLDIEIGLSNYSEDRGTSLPSILADPFVANRVDQSNASQ